MNITYWNPFKELEEVQDRLSGVLGRFPLANAANGKKEALAGAEWAPLVDICEDEKHYVVTAELPDVSKENVKVTVENGSLVIRGERKFAEEKKGRKYHRVERSYGTFLRSFSLPEDADAKQVTAEFKDGVLNIRIAKREESQPRQIEVKVG